MTDLNGAERLMSALRQVSTAEQRHAKAIARRLRMNASDLNALSFVVDRGSPTTGEVGRQLDLTSGAVTGVIDRLMKRGFVERVSDPRDRRKVAVRAVAAMIVPVSERQGVISIIRLRPCVRVAAINLAVRIIDVETSVRSQTRPTSATYATRRPSSRTS